MCRFLVYKGKSELLLSKLILDPAHSILNQSFDSRLRLDTRRPHNGDGFGVGYYTEPTLGPEPCIFTSTIPAWNCANLARLASKTASRLIFAHVRATTEGSSMSETNCHPFQRGALMWMHNGGIGGWRLIKRRLTADVADRWFLGVEGTTDSEWAFALFLDCLERAGVDPDAGCGADGFGHANLRAALLATIARINGYIDEIPQAEREGVDTRSLLNFAVTDGHSVVCSRYVGSAGDEAASLYFSSGTSWKDEGGGVFRMERRDKGSDIVLVASEPLTFERDNWVTVPTNSTITIHKQTVLLHPIVDKYYSHDPAHSRNARFASERGLVSDAPGAAFSSAADAGGADSPAVAAPRMDTSIVAERLRGVQRTARGLA